MSAKHQLAVLFTVVFTAALACAQEFRGSLVGTVTDTSGGRIAAAVVTLDSAALSVSRTGVSNGKGEFRFDHLAPARYEVTVKAVGFADARSSIAIPVASVQDLSLILSPAPFQQAVSVHGETTSTVQGGVVTQQDLENMPLAHRSFANIAFLIPGTEPVEPSDPTKARITAVSFGGSSGLNDLLSVDGGDDSDDYIGGFLQNFSPDAIQEFAVHTAQEDASTGRTVGGSVVITTKRGTNNWHGSDAFYERASALDARYPIENPAPLPKQPFSRHNYVGTLGGPVSKDRLWFFASLEAVHEDASVTYSPATLTQFDALSALAAEQLIPGVKAIPVTNGVSVPFRDYLGTVRLDWSQSAKSQWFLRAAIDNYTTDNAFVEQGTLASTGTAWHSNYLSLVVGQQWTLTPTWTSALTLNAGALHLTQARNSDLGFALAFPFSSTAQTISGFETFGDNQFVTPITAFPVLRNQQKYQARYSLSHASGSHAPVIGTDIIHEPVLSGALSGTAENLTIFAQDPTAYLGNAGQFSVDLACTPAGTLQVTPGTTCISTPAANGSFSQSVQRVGAYVQDSWRITHQVTLNYGIRYDTTFGLFVASGRSQLDNPALLSARALDLAPFAKWSAPHDYRAAFAPRLGIAWTPSESRNTVLRVGFGLFYNDLAQNGWVTAFQAVNEAPACCLSGGDTGALIDPGYKTPYALHATAGFEQVFSPGWFISANWTHEQGVHSYRRYNYQAGSDLFSPLYPQDSAVQQQYVPNLAVFRSDNRSRYDGLSIHVRGSVSGRLSVTASYTLASAKTWGCVLGELFDYVNGVCNPLNAFTKGDYGPSGEDVRHRAVVAGTAHLPCGFELGSLIQAESARPFTITNAEGSGRAVVNGVETTLDEFRGSPYIQADLRVSRPVTLRDRWTATPFVEIFNLFNRSNPGANYVTNIAALQICSNGGCTSARPIANSNQLRIPAGALGDFFGPGTTVGIPFAAQVGARLTF